MISSWDCHIILPHHSVVFHVQSVFWRTLLSYCHYKYAISLLKKQANKQKDVFMIFSYVILAVWLPVKCYWQTIGSHELDFLVMSSVVQLLKELLLWIFLVIETNVNHCALPDGFGAVVKFNKISHLVWVLDYNKIPCKLMKLKWLYIIPYDGKSV